jgi:hypothetical protein
VELERVSGGAKAGNLVMPVSRGAAAIMVVVVEDGSIA